MLMLISPAKKLDYKSPVNLSKHSQPVLIDHAEILINNLKSLTPQDVCSLMGLSDKLGSLNYERFQAWSQPFSIENARQAILAFRGDVYQGFEAYSMSNADLDWAQDHLRILSGLYGLLRPLDLIQPYRLEMGTKYNNPRGSTLYEFWGDLITSEINQVLSALINSNERPVLVNLASNEYFKSVRPSSMNAQIITPVFMDKKDHKYKVISFNAKRARGLMAAYAVRNRVDNADVLKEFKGGGYVYNSAMSTSEKLVFTRD